MEREYAIIGASVTDSRFPRFTYPGGYSSSLGMAHPGYTPHQSLSPSGVHLLVPAIPNAFIFLFEAGLSFEDIF